jgi:hypothetical protein
MLLKAKDRNLCAMYLTGALTGDKVKFVVIKRYYLYIRLSLKS